MITTPYMADAFYNKKTPLINDRKLKNTRNWSLVVTVLRIAKQSKTNMSISKIS
jgi:hypothetical protein